MKHRTRAFPLLAPAVSDGIRSSAREELVWYTLVYIELPNLCGSLAPDEPKTSRYFLSAREVLWRRLQPIRRHGCTGMSIFTGALLLVGGRRIRAGATGRNVSPRRA